MKQVLITLFLFANFFVAVSCTNNPEVKNDDAKSKQALVGVWRGEGEYEGEENEGWSESWKMVREANGKYFVEYLIVHDGDKLYEHSSDSGTWSYEDGEYYEVNNRGEKINYDVFSVKDDWFEYNLAERKGSANIQESKTVDTYQLKSPPKGYTEVTYEQSAIEDVEE